MGGDPLSDIMGYLGLEPAPNLSDRAGASRSFADDADTIGQPGRLLAATAGASLWHATNGTAEWIEIKGPFPTVRATRPKAQLLIKVRSELKGWADGDVPHRVDLGITVSVTSRREVLMLEVRYGTWKPMRLTREQAAAVVTLIQQVAFFARHA